VNGVPKKYTRMTVADLIDKYLNDYEDNVRLGRSKEIDMSLLASSPIASIETQQLDSGTYIRHIKKRLATGIKPQTANNDIVWIGVSNDFDGIMSDNLHSRMLNVEIE